MQVSVFIIFDTEWVPGAAAYAGPGGSGKRPARPKSSLQRPLHGLHRLAPELPPLWSNDGPRPGRRRESVKDNRQRPNLPIRVKASCL
jgi:hypothetical protein